MGRTKHHVRVGSYHEEGAHIEGNAMEEFGVFAFLTAAANTTCVAKDTWYPISGTFTNNPIEGFETTAGPPAGIVYGGGHCGRYFEIDWHASTNVSFGADTIKIGVLVNGTIVAASVMTTLVTTAALQMSGTLVVELEGDDVVTLAVQSAQDGTVITVTNFTTTICKFFANPGG